MILPPSTVLIIYGLEVEQSIGRLFIAGIVPSILIALLMMIVVTGWVMIRPEIAPRADKSSWKERLAAIPEALLILIVFGIVIGGMITGFFSPTEAGTIGTVAIFILALVRKEVNKVMFINSIKASLKTSIMVLMLIAGSNIFGHFLAITEIPMQAAEWASGLPLSGTLIMIVIIIYLFAGWLNNG
jgi:TRAP-type C4-dicarboxylate transport system permease large subunit